MIRRILLYTGVLVFANRSSALTLMLSPATDDRGQMTALGQYADRIAIDFGPVALTGLSPRTGRLVPTSWGYWLLATIRVTVTGSDKPILLARMRPLEGTKVRWVAGINRSDWGSNGFGIELRSADQEVANRSNSTGIHQIGLGIEDHSANGPRTLSVYLTALEEG